MRLGQLARKLSVRPSQIVDLLAKSQQYFDEGSNAKLNDDLVKHIVLHFAPERLGEFMAAQNQEAEEIEIQPRQVIEALEEVEEEPKKIDWGTWLLGLLAFASLFGLIPFWLYVYMNLRP